MITVFNPIYKIRRPLPLDKKLFSWGDSPHLFYFGAFNLRVLLFKSCVFFKPYFSIKMYLLMRAIRKRKGL